MAAVPWARVVFVSSSGAELAAWALGGRGTPDLGVVDVLARWQLAADRAGGAIRLVAVTPELAALLDLVGLRRELGGQVEGGEHTLDVQEGVEGGDPVP